MMVTTVLGGVGTNCSLYNTVLGGAGTNWSLYNTVLGGARTNCSLYYTCSLLCVIEQPRVDNSSLGPNRKHLVQLA